MVAVPTPKPGSGNAIAKPLPAWHQMLVSAFVVGISIWLIEQNVSGQYAMVLAVIILLGAMVAYPGFSAEFTSITQGKA